MGEGVNGIGDFARCRRNDPRRARSRTPKMISRCCSEDRSGAPPSAQGAPWSTLTGASEAAAALALPVAPEATQAPIHGTVPGHLTAALWGPTPTRQTFDNALWAAAESGHAPTSLRDVVEATFRGDRHQLTVAAVIADGCEPGERLAQAGAGAVSGFAWAGPIAVLPIGEGEDAYTVAAWPAADQGVYHLVGTAPVTDERWRLTEHLAERFAAREVADVAASSPPTRDELFTTG